jgi:hypothetical protein
MKGAENGVRRVADEMAVKMRQVLQTKVTENNGVYTGRLSNSIQVVHSGNILPSIIRSDIMVSESYQLWIEYGRNAPAGLPYSRVGTRNYKNSKFTGYRFMGTVIDEYSNGSAVIAISHAIAASLFSKSSINKLSTL